MSVVEERAARGAAWLDEVKPGWEEHIDLERLSIVSSSRCVAGQVFTEEAIKHTAALTGFDYVGRVYGTHIFNNDQPGAGFCGPDFRGQTEAWRVLISERLAAKN